METIKDSLLLNLDSAAGFRMVRQGSVVALCWAAEVIALLPDNHPLFWKLEAAHAANAEGWQWRQRELLSRWGKNPGEMSGMAFVIELGVLLDRFLDEEEG